MKLKNKKGFTMVELLAVIVILGILSVISISTVQGIIAKARDRYYKSQEDNMVMATQSYLKNNNVEQPKVSGQMVTIYLGKLSTAKYIDKVVDYKKNTCDESTSKVNVFKYEDQVYYTAYLDCPDYTTDLSNLTSNISITASFVGDGKNLNKASTTIKIRDKNENVDASGNKIDIPEGIVSYQYKIYIDKKLKYTSDLFNTNRVNSVDKTISLIDYVPGNVKVTVTATNMYGLSVTKSFSKAYLDGENPTCGEITGDSTEWKTGTRTIKVKCDDKNGSGCKRDDYTYEFTGDVKVGKIKIEDKAGNTTWCDVNVYIDNHSPILELKVYKKKSGSNTKDSNSVMNTIKTDDDHPNVELTVNKNNVGGWLNNANYPNGVYFELSYKDISSVSKIEWKWNDKNLPQTASNVYNLTSTTPFTPSSNEGSTSSYLVDEGYRYGQIIATDRFDHQTIINVKVPMDRTAPTYTTSGESTSWTKNNRTVTINCQDSISGCASSPGAQTFSSTIKTKDYTIKDKAGNSKGLTINIYVDKTAPSCGNATNDSTSWTKNDRNISVGCSDSNSGCSQSSFSKNFNTSTKKGTITISDNVGNTSNCSVNAYVDKTPPVCNGSTGASTSWTNSNRTVSAKCRDDHSGCTQSSFDKTFSSSIKVGQITIKDNVGWTTNCDVNAYVDKSAPTCGSISGASTSWTNGNRTITVNCNDTGGSGCSSVTKSFSSNTTTDYITLRDGAGNTKSCSVNVYIDKTAPSCGSTYGSSTSWTASDRNISVGCSDSGGSGCSQGSFSTYYNWTTRTGSIRIKDNAGNTRDCGVNVYVDKTRPYTPVVEVESGDDNTSITGDSCSSQSPWQFNSVNCGYTINMPNGQYFLIYWGPYAYDEGSGIDHFKTIYYCDGGRRQASYTEYLNWTNVESITKLMSSSGSTHCYQRIISIDRVGHESAILSYDEYINRY